MLCGKGHCRCTQMMSANNNAQTIVGQRLQNDVVDCFHRGKVGLNAFGGINFVEFQNNALIVVGDYFVRNGHIGLEKNFGFSRCGLKTNTVQFAVK